ncbi:MAG: hypothetical protein RIB60_07725 [Phycisphaerales bacterium]
MRTFFDRSTRRRPLATQARGLLVAGLLAAASHAATAQVETLDPRVISSSSISGSDRSAIESFVTAHAAGLTSDTFNNVRRSRTALLAPLAESNATVSFRNAYADAIWPTIESLLDADDATRRLTGMRLAGMLGTDEAAGRLVDLLMSDDAGVRVFAAGRLGDTLSTVGPAAAAISPDAAAEIIDALGDAIANDDEPRVADAAVRALEQAMQIRPGLLNQARARAIRVLSESASERIAALGEGETAVEFSLRVCGVVRAAVSTNDPVTTDAARAAIAAGADVLAGVVETYDARQPATDEQIGLVSAAEATIFFARRQHAQATNTPANFGATNFAQTLQAENLTERRDFRNNGVRFLQSLEDDYDFEAGRFQP